MRRVSLLLWMGPSLEENTVFNEGGRKQELPAASRKVCLFSFASFPLFMGMKEAGPIHPHSIPSLGLMRGAPRPPQTKISPQTATHKHNPCWTPQLWGTTLCPHSGGQRLAMCVGMRYQGLPTLQPHAPQVLYTQQLSAIPLLSRRN